MLATETSQPRGPGLIAVIVVLIAAMAGIVIASLLIKRDLHPILAILVPQFILLVVAIAAMCLGRWRPATCGVRLPRLRHLLLGLVLVPLIVGAAYALNELVIVILGPPPEGLKHLDEMLVAIRSTGGWGLLILLTCVLPGITEELLMRGVVLNGLRRVCPPWPAIIVTALLFAAMHGSPWRFMPQFALGVAVGWLAMRSGSCWPGALTHAAFNAVAIGVSVVAQKAG